MKKFLVVLSVVFISVMCIGCNGSIEVDQIKTDLQDFIDVGGQKLFSCVETANKEYKNTVNYMLTGNFNAITAHVDDNVIPYIDQALSVLTLTSPQTEELSALKTKCEEALQKKKLGYSELGKNMGLNLEDAEYSITEAEEILEEGEALFNEYKAEITELAEEYGLSFN